MIKPLIRKKEEQNITEAKKSLSLVPLTSATIGAFSYFQALVYLDHVRNIPFTDIPSAPIHFIMLSPGLLFMIIFLEIFPWVKLLLPDHQFELITYGISSIIPGIAGWILGSKNKSSKIKAVVLFILFILISIFLGFSFATFH